MSRKKYHDSTSKPDRPMVRKRRFVCKVCWFSCKLKTTQNARMVCPQCLLLGGVKRWIYSL
jgi:hypothetical protein